MIPFARTNDCFKRPFDPDRFSASMRVARLRPCAHEHTPDVHVGPARARIRCVNPLRTADPSAPLRGSSRSVDRGRRCWLTRGAIQLTRLLKRIERRGRGLRYGASRRSLSLSLSHARISRSNFLGHRRMRSAISEPRNGGGGNRGEINFQSLHSPVNTRRIKPRDKV